MGQSSPSPSRVADLKSMGANRSAMRPQWLVRPPTMRERNHWKLAPGAEVYGSPSISQAPLGARNSPKFSRAWPPTPAPRCGNSYGHISILKSFSGFTFGPASSSTQFRPPSVRIFAAIPPPAPEPIMQTSYCFGERITWAISRSSPYSSFFFIAETAKSQARAVNAMYVSDGLTQEEDTMQAAAVRKRLFASGARLFALGT